jgi:hypothetical protein
MKIALTVTGLDGSTRPVVAGFREQIGYEKFTGKPITGWQATPPGVYDFAVLAWIAETGQAEPFTAWTDTVEMVTFDGVESTDPTRPGVSPAPA